MEVIFITISSPNTSLSHRLPLPESDFHCVELVSKAGEFGLESLILETTTGKLFFMATGDIFVLVSFGPEVIRGQKGTLKVSVGIDGHWLLSSH
jgi:hypothetical protein